MIGWHHWLYGHEFEQVLRVGDGQGSLACCSSWSLKELDMTEQLNWTPESDIWTWWISIHSPKSNGQWGTWTITLYPSPVNMSFPPVNTAPVSLVHSICGHFPFFACKFKIHKEKQILTTGLTTLQYAFADDKRIRWVIFNFKKTLDDGWTKYCNCIQLCINPVYANSWCTKTQVLSSTCY